MSVIEVADGVGSVCDGLLGRAGIIEALEGKLSRSLRLCCCGGPSLACSGYIGPAFSERWPRVLVAAEDSRRDQRSSVVRTGKNWILQHSRQLSSLVRTDEVGRSYSRASSLVRYRRQSRPFASMPISCNLPIHHRCSSSVS